MHPLKILTLVTPAYVVRVRQLKHFTTVKFSACPGTIQPHAFIDF